MNLRRCRRWRWRVLPVALVTFVTLVTLVVTPRSVAAQEAPSFSVTFAELVPGEPQTQSATISIAESGWFLELAWIERTGIMADATLTVRICDPSGACVDGDDPAASPRFPAGPLTVEVTATLTPDAAPASTGRALGRLTFGNDDVAPPPPSTTTTTVPDGGTTTTTTTIAGGTTTTLAGGSGGLGPTGASSLSMALWAVALVAVGATLIAFTRHRRVFKGRP